MISILVIAAALAAQAQAQESAAPVDAAAPQLARPAHWAEPLAVEGAPNLHRLSPTLYRSEQPTALGMQNLEKLGIRTVINLRAFNDDDKEVKGTTLRTERIKILTWRIGDKHVIEVMRILKQTEHGPFLIHCQHGADRTGLMSAMYRILEQGWSPEDALKELVDGGYGYHSMWKNIVRYVRSVDVPKLRAAIGSAVASSTGSTSTVTDNL
jgi:protein tyrosine/serine phosphatase